MKVSSSHLRQGDEETFSSLSTSCCRSSKRKLSWIDPYAQFDGSSRARPLSGDIELMNNARPMRPT